jgi:uncharacterized protein (TIGR04255 family)
VTVRYAHPPIREQVIAINVEPNPDTGIAQVQQFLATEASKFPSKGDTLSLQFEVASDGQSKSRSDVVGQNAFSADKREAIQATSSQFAFARRQPYESWESQVAEARRIWEVYKTHVRPRAVVGLAIRTVNVFDFAADQAGLERYFRLLPSIPPLGPIASFFNQVQVLRPESGCMTTFRQGTFPSEKGTDRVAIVLDIEVGASARSPHDFDDGIWVQLQQLRVEKNFAFESCITDAMRETFQ